MNCNICGNHKLVEVLDLPNYPLNSIYLDSPTNDGGLNRDLKLFSCPRCNHFQASSDVRLNDIYHGHYLYTPTAPTVQKRVLILTEWLKQLKDIKFNRVIDVGCFDTSLLRQAEKNLNAKFFIGVDPSLSEKVINESGELILFKEYIEDVELPYEDDGLPDLILSDNTFEHIPNVKNALNHIRRQTNPNSIYLICVPSLEAMINKMNFQFIIHEHLHYFSVNTLARLFERHQLYLNSYYIDYSTTSNFLISIFTNKHNASLNLPSETCNQDYFKNYFNFFKTSLDRVLKVMENIKGNERIYGFGASDITSNFAYHLNSDLSFLDFILDETPTKQNKFLPNCTPKIIAPTMGQDFGESSAFITAPQASRYIIPRINDFKFKRIVNPLGITL